MESEHKRLRELSPIEINTLLEKESYAHLGCYAHGELYVTPITYVYQDGFIYSHSLMGKKIEMMRANPKVCVQVEEVHSIFNWRSVIIHGHFEELRDGIEPVQALRLLKLKIAELEHARGATPMEIELDAILSPAKIYRIRIDKMTGRAEGNLS